MRKQTYKQFKLMRESGMVVTMDNLEMRWLRSLIRLVQTFRELKKINLSKHFNSQNKL
jgi:hypothetical protein